MRGHWLEEEGEEGHAIDGPPYVAPVPVAAPATAKASAKAKANPKASAKASTRSSAKAKVQSKKKPTTQPAPGKRLRKKTKPAQLIEAGADYIGSSEEDEEDEDVNTWPHMARVIDGLLANPAVAAHGSVVIAAAATKAATATADARPFENSKGTSMEGAERVAGANGKKLEDKWPWVMVKDPVSGNHFYYNAVTGDTQEGRPVS